jgi:hypothetical protein
MKAEQRKELETNTLADRMGQLMKRVQVGERRTFLYWFGAVALAFVAAYLGYRYYIGGREARSEQWLMLYDGSAESLSRLAEKHGDTFAGKAARFQLAWFFFWDKGVKSTGADQRGAMNSIQQARKLYQELADACKDDPVFEPQALLGQAVCLESLAAEDVGVLKTAKLKYNELIQMEKYNYTAEVKFAQERYKVLNDATESKKLASQYEDLQRLLSIPPSARGKLQLGDLPR